MWSIYNYIRICHCFPRDKKVFKREPLMTINWPPSCAPVYSKYIFSVNQSAYVGPMYVMPILLPSGNEIVWVLDRYKKAEVIELRIFLWVTSNWVWLLSEDQTFECNLSGDFTPTDLWWPIFLNLGFHTWEALLSLLSTGPGTPRSWTRPLFRTFSSDWTLYWRR